MNLKLALCAALLLLTGCASTNPTPTSTSVHLTPEQSIALPRMELSTPISQEQLLTIHYQGRQEKVLVILEGQGTSLQLAVLSPIGIRLVDASYQNGTVAVTTHVPIAQLPPAAQVLFDIFLGLLPQEDIAAVLPQGFSLVDNGTLRTIKDPSGQVIEQVHFTPTTGNATRYASRVEHKIFGYVIEITTL